MDVLKRPAEEFDNDQLVEELWAIKAIEHAEIYFNVSFILISKQLDLKFNILAPLFSGSSVSQADPLW